MKTKEILNSFKYAIVNTLSLVVAVPLMIMIFIITFVGYFGVMAYACRHDKYVWEIA